MKFKLSRFSRGENDEKGGQDLGGERVANKRARWVCALCVFVALFCVAGLASKAVAWGASVSGCFCSEAAFAAGKCCREHPTGEVCPGSCVCPTPTPPTPEGKNSTAFTFPVDVGNATCKRTSRRYRGGILTRVVVKSLVVLAALGLVGTLGAVCLIYPWGGRSTPIVDKETEIVLEEGDSFISLVHILPRKSHLENPPKTPTGDEQLADSAA